MEESLFIDWVKRYFPGITISVTETLNGERKALTYLHKRLLTPEYSVDGKWESLLTNGTLVAADVVSMDSSLPLKSRPSTEAASGDIPKMGIELKLNEKELTALDLLVEKGADASIIIQKLFQDVPRCIGGIDERNEGIFLQGLSSGLALVDDSENVGAGVRIDFGYLEDNKFDSTIPFTDATATPFTDLQPLFEKATADGFLPNKAYIDQATYNAIAKSQEAKDLFAASVSFFGQNVPVPTFAQLNTAVRDRYGFEFEIINRSIAYEKNGVTTKSKPWKVGSIIFTSTENLGKIVWATLAEANHPVSGVEYQTANQYTLVSKYRMNRPSLGEFTNAQARVLPVISGVDQIYLFDSTVTEA